MKEILATFDLVPVDAVMIPIGAVLFIVFWKTFGVGVVKPFADLVAAREQATLGADDRSNAVRAEAAALRDAVEQQITEARVAALKIKFDEVAAAKASAAALMHEAEAAAEGTVQQARTKAQQSLKELRAQAVREADGLAQTFVEKARGSLLG